MGTKSVAALKPAAFDGGKILTKSQSRTYRYLGIHAWQKQWAEKTVIEKQVDLGVSGYQCWLPLREYYYNDLYFSSTMI
jgi:hypothetical protein